MFSLLKLMQSKRVIVALILLLFAATQVMAEDKLKIISACDWMHVGGLTKHEPFKDYIETHPGIGCEINKDMGGVIQTSSIDVMRESYGNWMLSANTGYLFPLVKTKDFALNAGAIAGLSYRTKRVNMNADTSFERVVWPYAGAAVGVEYKNFGVNVVYMPRVKPIDNPHVTFLQFKIRI